MREDRRTETLIAILRSPTGGGAEVISLKSQLSRHSGQHAANESRRSLQCDELATVELN